VLEKLGVVEDTCSGLISDNPRMAIDGVRES
jgi:hypothetical protein